VHGSDPSSVCAVLVAYRADPAVLADALAAVRPQVDAVVVVNNGPAGLALGSGDVLLQQDRNLGLAAGQNAGIAWARAQGFAHVLILDQDSICDPAMVAGLLDALAELSSGERVGAVGPQFRDPREDRPAPFVRVAFPMSRKLWCDGSSRYVQCDFLISSGALIPLRVLDDVGDLDAGLFIDNVDMEWSFRVRARGYSLFGVCAATMTHHLGDDRHPVLAGRAQVVRHGPVRLYFIMRNRVALYRLPHTPLVWIAQDVPRVFAKFFIFSVLVGPRPRNVRFMLRGLLDGMRGRRGPCPLEAAA
jgi:rhamnosyltransferase